MIRRTFLQTALAAGLPVSLPARQTPQQSEPLQQFDAHYFARFQPRVNRVVDIGPWVERKIDLNLENQAQGPAGENGQRLRARASKLRASDYRCPARTTRRRIATTSASSSCGRIA